MRATSAVLAITLLVGVGCTPALRAPGESVRVTGTIKDTVEAPLEIEVYERCSPHLYVFSRCPGRLLGQTKIARPGPFLVEIDPKGDEISVIAFRGSIGQETSCAVETRSRAGLGKAVEIALVDQPCPVQRPEPPRASARAPVSGY